MSYLCPVCNGLQSLSVTCPRCSGSCRDEGRLNDFFGPYSPYRPTDEISMTNGVMDLNLHRCTHVLSCPECGHTLHTYVQEWRT